jgi:hypothetical protein
MFQVKIRVYRYRVYDRSIDEYRLSTRMATREQIIRIQGEVVQGSDLDVDAALVHDGWTEKHFDPDRT